ncbi:MAG: ABC transporter permease [Thermoplasmata archaeon]|nr:ABC transporter permease [Thermoplasmata archaeon]
MRYALDALWRRKGRTTVTILGIGLATALVVVLLAVSQGVQTSSASLAAASGVDLLITSANTSLSSGTFPPVAGAHGLPSRVEAADPNVATASPWLVSSLLFANQSLYEASNASPTGSGVPGGWAPTSSGVVGWIPADNTGLETPPLLSGTGFAPATDDHFANGTFAGPSTHEVVLDQGLATVLHAGVGSTIWVGASSVSGPSELAGWFSNATSFRVVGLSGPFWLLPSALLGFFYLSELQTVVSGPTQAEDAASVVLVHLDDPSQAAADQTRLTTAFPSLTVFTLNNILGAVANAVSIYRTFGVLVGVVGVVVATLFTTTVLLMSVDDRSKEIAVLRALGYPRTTIGRFVVEEGLLLALFGFAVGLPLGAFGAVALNDFLRRLVTGLPSGFSFISLDAAVILSGLVEVLVVGLVASVAPAARAVTLPVVEELRAP